MTLVKICGIRDLRAADTACEAGADLLGFIFAEGRRRVLPEEAAAIIKRLPIGFPTVGVFLNQSPDEVKRAQETAGFTHLQLHGPEDPLRYQSLGLPILKVLPVSPEGTLLRPPAEIPVVYLLDTRLPHQEGGTGTPFDWHRCPATSLPRPFFVAGGLTPENVGEAIRALAPYGVDVSSGVETDGTKNPARIRAFIQNVRRTDHEPE